MWPDSLKLGILGGGQLGKMLIQAASRWHAPIHVLDPNPECSAAPYATQFTTGSFRDYQPVIDFGANLDRLTIEIEAVNTEALRELEKDGVKVFPSPEPLSIIQDKGLQKQFLQEHHIHTAPFQLVKSKRDLQGRIKKGDIKLPFVQKLRTEGYDGRGVQVVDSEARLDDLFDAPSVVEERVKIAKELSVIAARNEKGDVVCYDPVEMVFNPVANLVEHLICPARITRDQAREAEVLAIKTIRAFEIVGLLAVELFLDEDGEIWVNEVAPRPHNSGHHTIESCVTSQYELHLRAVLGLPLGSTKLIQPAVMVNLLGAEGHTGLAQYPGFEECLKREGVSIHLYGKSETRPFRKMGHVTITARTLDEALEHAKFVEQHLTVTT